MLSLKVQLLLSFLGILAVLKHGPCVPRSSKFSREAGNPLEYQLQEGVDFFFFFFCLFYVQLSTQCLEACMVHREHSINMDVEKQASK